MAAPLAPKTLAGQPISAAAASYSAPAIPLQPFVLLAMVLQLQATMNELIFRHNQLCTDTSHAGDAVTGAGAAATSLFTTFATE